MPCLSEGMGCECSSEYCTRTKEANGDRYVWGDNVHKAKTQAER